jgi:competence transcription factor ComK
VNGNTADPPSPFYNEDILPKLCRLNGRTTAGRSAADDKHIEVVHKAPRSERN